MTAKQGRVFRDARGREGIAIGHKLVVRLFGEFDCEYRRTQLLTVKTIPWRGQAPVKPLQFLGIIDGDDLNRAAKANGKVWGREELSSILTPKLDGMK